MKIYKRQFEHVTIYGALAERPAALDWLHKNGYYHTSGGPRHIKDMIFDTGQFWLTAHKQIDKKVKRITKVVL